VFLPMASKVYLVLGDTFTTISAAPFPTCTAEAPEKDWLVNERVPHPLQEDKLPVSKSPFGIMFPLQFNTHSFLPVVPPTHCWHLSRSALPPSCQLQSRLQFPS